MPGLQLQKAMFYMNSPYVRWDWMRLGEIEIEIEIGTGIGTPPFLTLLRFKWEFVYGQL